MTQELPQAAQAALGGADQKKQKKGIAKKIASKASVLFVFGSVCGRSPRQHRAASTISDRC